MTRAASLVATPAQSRRWVAPTVVIVAVFFGGWLLIATVFADTALSTPPEMIAKAIDDGFAFYANNAGITVLRAVQGYAIGNVIALVLAAFVLMIPRFEDVTTQLAVVVQCLPITAVGPLIVAIFGGQATAIVLASMLVFFATLIGSVAGAKTASRSSVDLVRAYRGTRLQLLVKVRLPSALPAIFGALKIAVPAALLGAILGEYLGGIDSGLGVALNAAQRAMESARVWNIAVLTGVITFAWYGLIALIGRIAVPWTRATRSPR